MPKFQLPSAVRNNPRRRGCGPNSDPSSIQAHSHDVAGLHPGLATPRFRLRSRLAYMQYNMGVINYIDVLDAQRRYFDAQVGVSNAVRDEYLALVQLYIALGGGV